MGAFHVMRGPGLTSGSGVPLSIKGWPSSNCRSASQPSVVVLLTDGGPLVMASGVSDSVTWPPWTLQHEPFRWDQRLFSVVLRMGAITQV
jgi:hypothetical protein